MTEILTRCCLNCNFEFEAEQTSAQHKAEKIVRVED